MRLLIAVAALMALASAALAPALAAEADSTATEGQNKATVDVVITFPGGVKMEGTLLKATNTGTLTVRTAGGEQEFRRQDWYMVEAKQRPADLNTARGLMAQKTQDAYRAAAKLYQKAYEQNAHLYIFGAEALDGRAQAEAYMNQYTQAAGTYKQLFSEYSGVDITAERRYRYAMVLKRVGGKDSIAEAIAQLERVIDATDDALTMRALNELGGLHYDNDDYYLALRSYLQVLILYGGQTSEAARKELALAKKNALQCCDKLGKSSSSEMKRRVARIRDRVENMKF